MKQVMVEQVSLYLFYAFPSYIACLGLALTPFLMKKLVFGVPAYYPVDTTDPFYFVIFYLYQTIGITLCATCNIVTDMTGVGLFLHAKAQIERLGLMMSQVCPVRLLGTPIFIYYSFSWAIRVNFT